MLDFSSPTAGYVRNNGFYTSAPTITTSGSFTSAAKVRFKINANTFYLDDLVLSTAAAANNAPTNISLGNSSIDDTSTAAAATVGTLSTTDADSGDSHSYSLVTNGASGSGSCGSTGDDNNASFQISGSTLQTASSLSAGSYNVCIQTSDGTDTFQKTFAITVNDTTDSDGNLTASAAVVEPVGLDTTVDTSGEAVDVFDFTLADGGGGDSLAMDISQIVLNVTGTASDTVRNQITWRLNGPDASNVTGTYNSSTDTITFSGLSVSVADGASETYTVNAYYNDTSNLTEDQTIILSIDGDTDVTTSSSGTAMGATSAVTNGSGTTIDVVATQLAFTTQPAGSTSGSTLTTQPVVTAQDAFGNTDVDFSEVVSVTEASAGTLSGTTSASASTGVATFTDLVYSATADQQSFTLTANDQDAVGSDLNSVDSNSVTSDVVATKLSFSTQPAPLSVSSGVATALTTVPVVQALDANDIVDTGYSTDITLAEVNGAGSATITGTGDTDGSSSTVSLTPSAGVATFTGLTITYTTSGSGSETFNLQASSGALTTANSSQLTATNTPTVTDGNISISGASGTGGTYKIGDTVTAVWDNSGSGDNNSGVTDVSVDFSQFGGGSSVAASESSGSWTATYTIVSGAIDTSNRNVSVTATNSNGPTTTADTTNATVDNIAPTVTDANLSISGASGTGGAYKTGDTVTVSWDNTASGDNNSDTISAATVNFSAFGGGSAVAASNSSGSWTATYTIVAGAIDSSNLNVSLTATDNAGNSTTTADGSNATVDNIAPTLTDTNLSISGASGTGGVFIAGDTVTASWSNTAGGDNNSDTIASLSVNFSAFGGGSAVAASNSSDSWTATYTLTAGSANGSNLNIAATATDNAGNSTTTADTSNASADTNAPSGHSVSFDDSSINAAESSSASFTFAGGEVGASYSYTISSSGGGTNVTGSGTLATATDQVASLDLSGLGDGTLTLSVTLTDSAGNAATAVTDTSTLDAAAPSGHSVSFDDSAINASEASNSSFTFAAGEVGASYSYTISSSGGGTNVTGSGTLSTATDQITSLDLSGLSDGTLTLSVTVTDTAGNSATAVTDTSTLDTAAPSGHSVSFDDSVLNASEAGAASFTFAGGEVGASFSYSISSSGGGTAVTGSGTLASATDQITGLDLSGLADGTLTLTVSVTDTAGNSATAVTDTSTLDATAPSGHSVSFDDSLINSSEASLASFTFAAGEVGAAYSYTISSSGGGTNVTGSGTLATAADQITGLDLSGLGDGTLTLSVILTDTAGNAATGVTDTSTLDASAPSGFSVTLSDSVYNASEISSVYFTFANGEVGADYEYSYTLNGITLSGLTGSLATATDQSVTTDLSAYGDGTLTLQVTMTDSAGNLSVVASDTATVDTTAPAAYGISFDDSLINASEATSVSISMAGAEVGASYSYGITSSMGGTPLSGSGTVTSASQQITGLDVSALMDGTLEVALQLTDSAGNSGSSVTGTSTLDMTAPFGHFVSFDSPLIGSADNTAASFSFAGGEVGASYSYSISSSAGGTPVTGSGTLTSATDQVTGIDLSGLEDGTLTLTVVVTDSADNDALEVGDFTLLDTTPPSLASSVPADNATDVAYNSTLVLTLSEAVAPVSGSFHLYDADGDTLVESLAVGSGQVSFNSAGTVITITPSSDFTPTHSYYLLADSGIVADIAATSWAGISDKTELNFTVGNNAPVGTADSSTTNEDNAVAIDVLANDSDVDSTLNAASVTVTNAPSHGSTSVNTANGVITYTPAADYNGTDTFAYAVDDIYSGNSGDITVTVTVNPVNDAPVAVADTASTAEDTEVSIDVADNDTDVDSGDSVDTATLTIVSQPTHGTASVVSGEILYNPDADFNGSDSLTYQIDDQNGATSNVATLIINISGVNDAPVAANDSSTTDEDTDVVIDVLANDSDIDGILDVSQVTIIADPTHGTVAVDTTSGEITYSPTADYNGSDSFTYVVKDNEDATSNIATVSLTITSVNDAPVANDDSVTLMEDATLNINALGNDTDVDGSLDITTVEITTEPTEGSATVNSDGSIAYTPAADFNGSDSLSYRVMDDLGEWSNTATVTLTITAVNDAPLANDDSATTDEDTAVTIDVAANDSDIDGSLDLTSVLLISNVLHGNLIDNGDGTLSYTPDQDFYGSDTFVYQISDNEAAASESATVTITVNPVNDAPVISGTPASSVLEGATFSFTPTVTDVDSNTTTLVFSLSGQPDWMTIDSATGAVTGTPPVGSEGDYSNISILVNDGGDTFTVATFSLSVIGDFDTDGIANSEDPDIDNDGMTNDYEEQYGFDPYDDSDALEDADGDTISNADEEADGTDPTDADDYFDETAPVVTAPADVTIDANALFTRVSLSTLLGDIGDISELTSDNVDGSGCCNTVVDDMTNGVLLMSPGRHVVTYTATDRKGNVGTAEQVLRIRPLVSFSRDIQTVEGATATFKILLNGPAPDYPLEVPFVIASSSTADSADYSMAASSVTFTAGETSVSMDVSLTDDGIAEGTEILVLQLDDDTSNSEDLAGGYDPDNIDIHDINAGATSQLTISISEENLPPVASMTLKQAGSNTVQVTRSGGLLTASVSATDPNPGDTLSYDWSNSTSTLADTDGSLTNSSMVINPSSLSSGRYKVEVKVTDSQGASDVERIYFLVVDELPDLQSGTDSDGDGVDDADEGTGDDDNDGIPDYLDNISATNLLPEQARTTDSFLVECDPGVRCRLGQFAMQGSGGGARLNEDELDPQGAGNDSSFQPVGGIFDFELNDLPTFGQSVKVVLPQIAAIPADAIYRKYQNGSWRSFVTDSNNEVHSAAGELGYCPPPGDDSWEAGLIEGYYCVQLTIEDGGPNDADGEVNGSVEDPGAVSVLRADQSQVVDVTTSAQNSGGALGWLSLIGLAGLAGAARKARRSRLGVASRSGRLHSLALVGAGVAAASALSLTAPQTHASDFADKSYLFLGSGQAQSSLSRSEFEGQLQAAGQNVEVTRYDSTRGVINFGIGYEYRPGYALELSYLDMGDADTALQGTVVPNELKPQLRRDHPVGGAGWMLNQVLLNPLTDQLSLTATAGIYYWQGQVETSRADLDVSLKGGYAPLLGLGLKYQLTERYQLGGGLKRLMFDRQQLDIWSLRLGIGF
ncbi:tandem-95 repeat protein [Oceanobacter mangrovi]|uniref:tandem-95 repeat protein n=1 Tax=Oceanobacter mangrovi TaxID=2862510 RepID=UPI001C8E8281|nr:Ig-like domain-containing protein [Oceanobacter mangrovi]